MSDVTDKSMDPTIGSFDNTANADPSEPSPPNDGSSKSDASIEQRFQNACAQMKCCYRAEKDSRIALETVLRRAWLEASRLEKVATQGVTIDNILASFINHGTSEKPVYKRDDKVKTAIAFMDTSVGDGISLEEFMLEHYDFSWSWPGHMKHETFIESVRKEEQRSGMTFTEEDDKDKQQQFPTLIPFCISALRCDHYMLTKQSQGGARKAFQAFLDAQQNGGEKLTITCSCATTKTNDAAEDSTQESAVSTV